MNELHPGLLGQVTALALRTDTKPTRGPSPGVPPLPAFVATDHAPTSADPAASVANVHSLTDAQLGREWRRSCIVLLRLQSTRDIGGQAVLVERRQAYLDEFEKRCPASFAHWLTTAAQPGSDPLQFIVTDQHDTRPGRPEPRSGGAVEGGASADAG